MNKLTITLPTIFVLSFSSMAAALKHWMNMTDYSQPFHERMDGAP